jgi:hypothetical protein
MMILHLDLSTETETHLREQAAADGKDIGQFVREAVEAQLTSRGMAPPTSAPLPPSPETAQEWIARFDAWVQAHPTRGYVADDSRESIYAGRGE